MTSDSGMLPPPKNPTPIRTRFWTAKEVAQNLGMSLRWVRKAAADGRLPCIRRSDIRAVRFDPNVVRAWFIGREQRVALATAVEQASSNAGVERRRHSPGRRASDRASARGRQIQGETGQ
jgi:predicted DNA-binding transcriptional regulator AlpA